MKWAFINSSGDYVTEKTTAIAKKRHLSVLSLATKAEHEATRGHGPCVCACMKAVSNHDAMCDGSACNRLAHSATMRDMCMLQADGKFMTAAEVLKVITQIDPEQTTMGAGGR